MNWHKYDIKDSTTHPDKDKLEMFASW